MLLVPDVQLCGKPEVSQLVNLVFAKNVFRLNVSMDIAVFHHLFEGVHQLVEDLNRQAFLDISSIHLQQLSNVALGTVFQNYVLLIFIVNHFDDSENVGRLKLVHYRDFVIKGILVCLVLRKHLGVYDFNGNFLAGYLINSFEDFAVGAFTDESGFVPGVIFTSEFVCHELEKVL